MLYLRAAELDLGHSIEYQFAAPSWFLYEWVKHATHNQYYLDL